MGARLAVRLRGAPPPPAILSPVARRLSLAVHRALYALLLLTPLVGWFALSAYGLGPSFFGVLDLPQLIGKDEPLAEALFKAHLAGGLLIGALVFVHVAAALRHAVRKDGVVSRMATIRLRRP